MMNTHIWSTIIICCTFQTITTTTQALYCDRIFQSQRNAGNPAGSYKFEAPTRVAEKPFKIFSGKPGDLLLNKNSSFGTNAIGNSNVSSSSPTTKQAPKVAMHCLYKFIAKDDEKVALNFSSFKLRGNEPECTKEYVDIFVTFSTNDDLETAIGQEQPNGRFCTTVVPHRVVSLHNMIVLSIHSELDLPADNKPLFYGQYEFFKPKLRDQIGPPKEGTLCAHTIYSSGKREGEFQSITYPGSYIKNLHCSYRFIGEPNQRIRLEFLDMDLYSGGPHCPFDSVKVFDGLDEAKDPIIQIICGSHRSLVIYSTREHILVTFTTLKREVEVRNRGFSAYFEFSDKFFNPDFIQGEGARHIRGSECDQRIVSNKGTKGLIVSPESKNHPNAICRYFFEGLQNSMDYEKVLLKFIEFDLETQRITGQELTLSTTTTTTTSTTTAAPDLLLFETGLPGSPINVSVNVQAPNLPISPGQSSNTSSGDQTCSDNYVRLYTGEQKPVQKQDLNDYDYVFCSNEVPPTIESDAASLMMEYNSGTIGGKFKAEYKFIVDYRIPGQQLASGCNFLYKSDSSKTGSFNSPRYPSWYINDMNCTYTLLTKSDEVVLLQFVTLKMANSFGEKDVGSNEACKGEDSVEISELVLDSSERVILDRIEIGTYCGKTTPGPLLSYKPVRITLSTNKERVHYGFSAIYTFHHKSELNTNEFVTNCGEQINSKQWMQRSGSFSSPPTYRSETYEKRNHICSWNITARPSHRIQLDFNRFAVEGSPAVRGCAAAAVRLESNPAKKPIELCGTLNPANSTARRFVSDGEWLAVTFISTKRASGSDGFLATWTEIKKSQI